MCIALCTIVAHNIAQNRPDSFPPYPPDNHHCSNDVGVGPKFDCAICGPPRPTEDKILTTVPLPTSLEKKSEILWKITNFSSYVNFHMSKKLQDVDSYLLWTCQSAQPPRFCYQNTRNLHSPQSWTTKHSNGVGDTVVTTPPQNKQKKLECGPRDALSQLKSCQLLHKCTKNHISLEGLPFRVV